MYELLVRHLFGPALDFARGTRAMRLLKEMEATQWWPRDRILALQDERLGELVRYAYDNVPYYRTLLDQGGLKPEDIRGSRDLAKLPVLTRKLVRKNSSRLRARSVPGRRLRTVRTGGSTGEPLEFYRARDDISSWDAAAGLRASRWAGHELGMKCAWFSESPLYESSLRKLVRTANNLSRRITLFDARELSEEQMPLLAARLERFQDGIIRGYPTAIYLLGRFIEREGKRRIKPRAIITSGEGLYDFQRDLLTRVFQCDVFSHYKSNEVNVIAGECPEHSGHHVSAENVIVEVVDDEGRRVPAQQEGRILVTNLHSHVMPFIRYEIGDVGVASDDACPCGRGLPLLAMVKGRITDVVYTKSGRAIPGVVLPINFLASLGVDQFQVVQHACDRVAVRFVLGPECSPERADAVAKEIARHYRDALGDGMSVDVERVGMIAPTESGKRRIVVSSLAGGP
jgi:phenylacetate-CoA ligase